jgi:hypothetical protein
MHSSDFAIKRFGHEGHDRAPGGTHAIASGYYYQRLQTQRDAVPATINFPE